MYVFCLKDQTSKQVSVIIVGCQIAVISDRLKSILVNKVQEMCRESLCGVVITIKFVSKASLKKDILEFRHHLYDTASVVRLSFG